MTVTIDELRTNDTKREEARKFRKFTLILSSGKKAEFDLGKGKKEGGSCAYEANVSEKDEEEILFVEQTV